MAQRQTVADFGLRRGIQQSWLPSAYTFLDDKVDPVSMSRDGQIFFIEAAENGDAALDQVSFTYVKCVTEKTLVVFAAFLQSVKTKARHTDMRAWQIIADGWLTEAGNQPAGAPEDLRYLAFHDVTEDASRDAIVAELDSQLTSAGAVRLEAPITIEFTSASTNWSTNPWIRCAERVAAALSTPTQRITASKAYATYVDDVGDEFHLVVEFTATAIPAAPPTTQA